MWFFTQNRNKSGNNKDHVKQFLGVNHGMSPHGFYEPPYEPSPSGSTGSAGMLTISQNLFKIELRLA